MFENKFICLFPFNMVNLVYAFFYIKLLNFYKDKFLPVFPLDSFCQASKIMLLRFDKSSITSKTYFFQKNQIFTELHFSSGMWLCDYICHLLLFSKALCVILAIVIVVFQIFILLLKFLLGIFNFYC